MWGSYTLDTAHITRSERGCMNLNSFLFFERSSVWGNFLPHSTGSIIVWLQPQTRLALQVLLDHTLPWYLQCHPLLLGKAESWTGPQQLSSGEHTVNLLASICTQLYFVLFGIHVLRATSDLKLFLKNCLFLFILQSQNPFTQMWFKFLRLKLLKLWRALAHNIVSMQ